MKKADNIDPKNSQKKFDFHEYNLEYHKKNMKRIPLSIQIKSYEKWKKYADIAGLPLNTFIKRSVEEKIASMADSYTEEESGDTIL